jgi:uncharacterized membrane protein YjjP (DUF1212 family)
MAGMIKNKMLRNPRTLLLLDGIGALVTALLVLLIRYVFNAYFNVPDCVLAVLAGIAFCFCVFSLGSYLFTVNNWRACLNIIW